MEGARALALRDRYYLLIKLLGRHDAWHPWVYARCREVEADPDGYLDIWGREMYKSSVVTCAGIIQEVLRDPEVTVGIFSHTKHIAMGFLAQIQREFEANEKLKLLFPDVLYENPERDSPSWSLSNGLILKRRGNPKEGTIEGWGLVDGMPTGKHFKLMVYDDVVTKESVNTPEQIHKTTEAWELSDNLGMVGGRKWMLGTRYCTVGSTRILMADWTHKPIEDVRIGDMVVGWRLEGRKRYLRPVKVLNAGAHLLERVNRYTFENGRSVTCTPDHLWWRGPHGGGAEYNRLSLGGSGRRSRGVKAHKGIQFIRQLMVPVEQDKSWEAGWLAGMFDGEGTTVQNKGPTRVSGGAAITQTMANPGLITELRRVMAVLGFSWWESWYSPSKGPVAPSKLTKNQPTWHDRCVFHITGGWKERYRFLAQLRPAKFAKLASTLFAQLHTDKVKLVKIDDAGRQDVFWLETESGNYIAEGFCSKNSYGDTYAEIMKRGAAKPRVYPATSDGTITGKPILMRQADWDAKVIAQGEDTISTQNLCNPLAGKQRMFNVEDLQVYEVRPQTLAIYIMVDPARSKKKDSANTAMAVIGMDYAGNKFLLDGFDHKMNLSERWTNMRDLWERWKQEPGVMAVNVGYEKFGAQADMDYFEEREKVEKISLGINELEWPNEGPGSKVDRVQRLGPDFRSQRFYLPYATNPKRMTKLQREMVEQGYEYRVARPILRLDENGAKYDLSERFRMQVSFFPLGGLKDLVDAVSRIYDMDPTPPVIVDQSMLEPEYT